MVGIDVRVDVARDDASGKCARPASWAVLVSDDLSFALSVRAHAVHDIGTRIRERLSDRFSPWGGSAYLASVMRRRSLPVLCPVSRPAVIRVIGRGGQGRPRPRERGLGQRRAQGPLPSASRGARGMVRSSDPAVRTFGAMPSAIGTPSRCACGHRPRVHEPIDLSGPRAAAAASHEGQRVNVLTDGARSEPRGLGKLRAKRRLIASCNFERGPPGRLSFLLR